MEENNNDVPVNIETVSTIFKDENGSIVGIESGYSYDSIIDKGESAYINVYYPTDADYNEVSFDEYEVYIMQASKNY